jgi:multidrug efflux pump subunit AcrA (membrane-fusion protein)
MGEGLRQVSPPPAQQDLAQLQHPAWAWAAHLRGVGVALRGVAVFAADEGMRLDFPDTEATLQARWVALRAQVSARQPVCVSPAETHSPDLLMCLALEGADGQPAVVGVALLPPCTERTMQLVRLSAAWLQLAWRREGLTQRVQGAQLLDMLAHVASHDQARTAAQDWLNRSAVLARQAWPVQAGLDLSLSHFHVRRGVPRWWVTSETAWAETGAPALAAATELAMQAVATLHEVDEPSGWALPVLADGQAVGVLVAVWSHQGQAQAARPDGMAVILRASLALVEPLLRQWALAERGLLAHAWASVQGAWRKGVGPGHLGWKAGSVLALVLAAVLGLVPVDERVTANTVIEGQTRQLVTAPFDGFLAQVRVRPGERVREGQVLAVLDDRDIRLDQAAQRSAREQAAGKLRQALAERDTGAAALAQAELQQAEAQLTLADTKLARVDLRAPMSGLVVSGDWSQKLGSPVDHGKEMFEVADTDGYRVVLHVPDHDIPRVKLGQSGQVRLTGHPSSSYPFRISRVTSTASVEEGVNGFRVEAQWVGPLPPLSPGMQGVGKVDVGRTVLLDVWTRSTRDWLQLKLWAWLW